MYHVQLHQDVINAVIQDVNIVQRVIIYHQAIVQNVPVIAQHVLLQRYALFVILDIIYHLIDAIYVQIIAQYVIHL